MTFPQGSSPKVQKVIQEFLALSLEEKRKKMINITKSLDGSHPVFSQISDILEKNKNITEEFLIGIYEDLMYFADAIEQNKKQDAFSRLGSLQDKLEQLRKQEEQERGKDQKEADDMIVKL